MSWKHRVNVQELFRAVQDGKLPLNELIKEIVPKLRELRAPEQLLNGLECAQDIEEFDVVWNEIYDWADDARVWIET